MSTFIWNDSLSVKIKSIDNQHKKLIDMINDFYENIKNRSSDDSVHALIDNMKKYTVMHFNHEEKYMKDLHYPDYLNHKKEHDLFIEKVKSVEEKLKNVKIILSFEITDFLKDWVKNHIQGSDQKYTEFFLKHGVV